MKSNAVLYLRYSSHSQNEQSIDTQRDICKAYALKNNYEIIEEYIDEAKTGTTDKRDNFQKMIEDSKKGIFDYIITYKVDRFARDKYDSAIYKKQLQKMGIRVLSACENITDDPEGALMEGVLETLAHYYSLNLSRNIKDGMYTNAKKGLSTGGQSLPLGYKSVKETREIVVDEGTVPTVIKIFEMYRDNTTYADIIRYLNNHGLKTCRGNEFNKNSLRRILINEKYIGIYRYKDEVMPVNIPAIVDEKLFYEVQEMLLKRKEAPARARATEQYLLTTKLFCGHCEDMMTAGGGTSSSSSKKRYKKYVCKNAKLKDDIGNKLCNKSTIDKNLIEDFVILKARELMTDENIDNIANSLVEYVEKQHDKSNVNRLNKAIKNNEKERTNLFESLKLCTTDSMRLSILGEISKMEDSLKQLQIELKIENGNGIKLSAQQIKYFLRDIRKGSIYDESYRQWITDIFIKKVYLWDNDDVMIAFTIQGLTFNGKIPSKEELLSSFKGLLAPPF